MSDPTDEPMQLDVIIDQYRADDIAIVLSSRPGRKSSAPEYSRPPDRSRADSDQPVSYPQAAK